MQTLNDVNGVPLLITSAELGFVAGQPVTLVDALDEEGREYSLSIDDGILQDALYGARLAGFPVCATFIPSGDGWTVSEEDCGGLFTGAVIDGKTPPNLADFVPGLREFRTLGRVTGTPLMIIRMEPLFGNRIATLVFAVDDGGREHVLLVENSALQGALLRAEQAGFPVCATFIPSGDGWTVSEEDCRGLFAGVVASGKILLNLADLLPGHGEKRTLEGVAGIPLAIIGMERSYVGRLATLVWTVDERGQKHLLLIENSALREALANVARARPLERVVFVPSEKGWTVVRDESTGDSITSVSS